VLAPLSGKDLGSLSFRKGKVGMGFLLSLIPLTCLIGFFVAMGGVQGVRSLPRGTFVSWIPWLVTFSVANGFMEELWFRGLWLDRFSDVLGGRAALALTTVIFTGMHLGAYWGGPILVLAELTVAWTVLGFFAGWITQKTGSLWSAVLVHALYDVAFMVKYFAEL
jgi:membrane protease YdiL (CAAX protease family)